MLARYFSFLHSATSTCLRVIIIERRDIRLLARNSCSHDVDTCFCAGIVERRPKWGEKTCGYVKQVNKSYLQLSELLSGGKAAYLSALITQGDSGRASHALRIPFTSVAVGLENFRARIHTIVNISARKHRSDLKQEVFQPGDFRACSGLEIAFPSNKDQTAQSCRYERRRFSCFRYSRH